MIPAPTGLDKLAHWRQWLSIELGSGVGVALREVHGDPAALFPEEARAVAHAIPRRQSEFAAGREAAREAMRQIGWPALAVPSAADRSPVWPAGLIGSISHSATACLAVVADKGPLVSIGVDIEDHRPIDEDLWRTICTPAEVLALQHHPEPVRGLVVARLFSAKEAVYKWQYPLTGRLLDFQDVHIELRQDLKGFIAEIGFLEPSSNRLKTPLGRLASDQHHLISLIRS